MMSGILNAVDVREAGVIALGPVAWHRSDGVWSSETLTADGDRCTTCRSKIPNPPWGGGSCVCTRMAYRAAQAGWYEHHDIEPPEWERAGVPPRHAGARFSTFTERPGTETALARCVTWAAEFAREVTTRGLYLSGPWGSGKTHLVVATAYRVCQRTLTGTLFETAGGLISAVKGGADLDYEPVDRALGAELLVLDDIGQIGRTEFDRELIYSLIAERYEQALPTLFTSNLPVDRLADSLGGAAVSRLYESTTQVVVTASDYRQEKGPP